MIKTLPFITMLFISIMFTSCNKEGSDPSIENITIHQISYQKDLIIPYEDSIQLKKFSSDKEVINYKFARKLAMIELIGTGFLEEMHWDGCKLSTLPVVFYDFNGKPKYYDYIMLDAENKPVGKVTVHAKRKNSTILKTVSPIVPDYNEMLTKFGASNNTFFIDWMGNNYIGGFSKTGTIPTEVINTNTGKVSKNIQEFDDKEIIEEMEHNILPEMLVKDVTIYEKVPATLINDDFKEEINIAKTLTVKQLKDSMQSALNKNQQQAEAYWNTISQNEKDILTMSDEDITNKSSKFFGRFFRRIFSRVDRGLHYIQKYENQKNNFRRGGWCGPWVCGYIVYANQQTDQYAFFENEASTFGEFGILNISLRLLGRPMTPMEMARSMPIASKGKIWISPVLCFADLFAYDQIKHYEKPAIRMCSIGGSLHWTLAYGAKQTGNWLWRNYYFLQIDNGTSIGNQRSASNSGDYTAVDWWNPWLMVWD